MNILIRRLIALYGEPNHPDVEAFFSELLLETERDSEKLLNDAFDKIKRAHKRHSWPAPGEIVGCLDQVRREHHGKTPQQAVPKSYDPSVPHPLLRGPIVTDAARRGWVFGLNQFLYERNRLPTAKEIDVLVLSADCVEEVAMNGTTCQLSGRFQALANSFMVRRRKLHETIEKGGPR